MWNIKHTTKNITLGFELFRVKSSEKNKNHKFTTTTILIETQTQTCSHHLFPGYTNETFDEHNFKLHTQNWEEIQGKNYFNKKTITPNYTRRALRQS